jgi:hypothetical protein
MTIQEYFESKEHSDWWQRTKDKPQGQNVGQWWFDSATQKWVYISP